MPREPRQFEIGGVYHVVNRGVEKRKIFMKNQDYSRFILALEFFNSDAPSNLWEIINTAITARTVPANEKWKELHSKNRTPLVELLAFTLMPNHYHLILREITDDGIIAFMRKMGGYSAYFNKQYNRVGPLLQGRYKAVSVSSEIQLGNLFNYVHTNPVELTEPEWKDLKVKNAKNAINWLSTYRWSSYHDYIGNEMFPDVTQRDFFIEFFGDKEICRQSVDDWIKFKAQNAKLGSEIIE